MIAPLRREPCGRADEAWRCFLVTATQISEGQAQTTVRVRLKQVPLLTRSRKRVLNVIAAEPGVTMSQIAREFGWHVSAIDYHVYLLRQAGFVVRRKGARGYSYALYLNGEAP